MCRVESSLHTNVHRHVGFLEYSCSCLPNTLLQSKSTQIFEGYVYGLCCLADVCPVSVEHATCQATPTAHRPVPPTVSQHPHEERPQRRADMQTHKRHFASSCQLPPKWQWHRPRRRARWQNVSLLSRLFHSCAERFNMLPSNQPSSDVDGQSNGSGPETSN